MFGLCVRAYACACVRVCACVRGESTPELGVPSITARLLAGSRCLPTNKSVLCPISPPFSAEKHRGDMVAVMLQEICTYDADDKVTMLQGKTKGPEIAECVLQACPVASVRTQRGALGALGAASGPPFLEINLQACGRARLGGPCSGPHVPVPVDAALHACMHACMQTGRCDHVGHSGNVLGSSVVESRAASPPRLPSCTAGEWPGQAAAAGGDVHFHAADTAFLGPPGRGAMASSRAWARVIWGGELR